MIRLVYVLTRRDHLSRQEFQDYWRDVHGPLVAKHSTTLRIRRYVQSHTLDDPMNDLLKESRGTLDPYDGVAELWWNHEDQVAEGITTTEGQEAAQELLEDEKNFIDFSRSSLYWGTELPQINPTPENIVAREGSPIVKLCFFGSHNPELSREEAALYWRMHHGPLVRSLAQAARIKRYLQVQSLETPLNEALRGPRGEMAEPFDGHAELWFDRLELVGAAATPEGARVRELLIEDEAKFTDFSRSALWIAKEHVFIDR
jgi:uncharacterized protein (TIGR02118 family)